jgi:hypothetical protein
MNDNHRHADFENLEPPLQAAVKAAMAEPIPADAIERVKSRARQLAATTAARAHDPSAGKRGWKASRSLIAGLTAAAALLIVATVGILSLNFSGSQAFGQVIEKVKAARSVHFTMVHRFGTQREEKAVVYIEGSRMRMEQFNGMLVSVADVDRKQCLVLNTSAKLAQKVKMDADAARAFNNPIDQLRHVKLDDAKKIGQEMLGGRRTQVYRFDKADMLFFQGKAEMLVWVDVESELPAKIEIRRQDPKSPIELRFDKFVWNEPLDPSLFSLAIPDGFNAGSVVTIPKAPPPAPPYADNPNYATDGILSRDRVPAQIVWSPQGKAITALMRDPESTQAMMFQEHELRQWDVSTGKLRWSQKIRGADQLAQTADGKTLAIVIGWEVQLRDAASGNVVKKWATDERLLPLAFSPNGKTLAAGIAEWGKYGGRGGKMWGGVQFWNVKRATLLRTIKSDDKPVQFIKYSVDGRFLATSAGMAVKLWDVSTGELARVFAARHCADFSPDGRTIACQTASPPADKSVDKVDLYKIEDASFVKSFLTDKGPSANWVTSIMFSPDGRLLAATNWNGTVTLWDVASGQRKLTLTDHQGGVLSAAFAPDGKTLATGSEDKTLRLRTLPPESIGQSPQTN